MKIKPFKMQNITPVIAYEVQRIIFANGGEWIMSGKKFITEANFGYIYWHDLATNFLSLRHGESKTLFDECETPELTYSQFIKLYDK